MSNVVMHPSARQTPRSLLKSLLESFDDADLEDICLVLWSPSRVMGVLQTEMPPERLLAMAEVMKAEALSHILGEEDDGE